MICRLAEVACTSDGWECKGPVRRANPGLPSTAATEGSEERRGSAGAVRTGGLQLGSFTSMVGVSPPLHLRPTTLKPDARLHSNVPEPVETTDPDGLDYAWVMQTTFVVTIAVGAPLVAVLSTTVALPTWAARASFAVRVGAVVWILTALSVYAYARHSQ